jgi:hypothetical protein
MRSRPFALVIAVVSVPVLLAVFYEGRKAYWDMQVKEMCEKDGGAKVFESVAMSAEDFKRLGGDENGLPIPFAEDQQKKDFPYYREISQTQIRGGSPTVSRLEMRVRRRSDGKELGRSVHYIRSGGDIPTGLFNDSSYTCPRQVQFSKQIFTVQGVQK